VFGRNIFWHPIEFIKGVRETANQLRTTEPGSLLKKFKNLCTRCGIEFGREAATDQATSVVERNILSLKEKTRLHLGDKAAHGVEAAAKIVGGTHLSERYFGRAGRHVGLFPALKLWATRRAAEELVRSYDPELTFDELDERGQEYIVRKLAKSINDAYGGQLWADYLWATPRVRQILNGLMFALNWTLSAWNIAGGGALTGQILGNPMSQAEADFVTRNTIAMAVYVLFLIPNLAQFAIWAAFGSPDDDDKPFSFLNEETRKSYIDITPLARVFGYDGDPTGKRRIYLRFGKQAYEVYDGWLTEPGAQAARKLSQPVKMVIEQMTGKSPGSDWNLEFQGQGMKGWLDSADEGLAASFLNSRFGYIVQKFIPMSVAQIIKDPQLGLAPFFAPTSRGTSQGKATADLILLYRSLAEDNNWKEFRKFPEAMANLEGAGQQILDGAARNGYDTQLIKKTAKGVVLADLYKRFAAAMNDLDVDRMDSLADRIIRVGGSLQGLRTSQALKKRAVGKEVSAEEAELMASAFESPVLPIERALEEASPKVKTPKPSKHAPVPGRIEINEGDADLTLAEAKELKRSGDLPSSMSAVEAARRSSFLASLGKRELDWLNEEIVAPRTPGAVSPGRLEIDEADRNQNTEKARFLSSLSGKEIRWLNQLIRNR
jgi:hypothetical protein